MKGYLFKGKSLHKVAQRAMDGAMARFYKINKWNDVCTSAYLKITKSEIAGTKSLLVVLPPGKIKRKIMNLIPNSMPRFFSDKWRMAYFLISYLEKA